MRIGKKLGLLISIIILFGAGVIQTSLGFSAKNLLPPLNEENGTSGNILYVGGSGQGNYSKIQDAIDNAATGDTIFVYSGVYYENIRIRHTINLIGQNKNTTIIDGNKTGIVVNITTDNVNITGFTIQNSGTQSFSGGIVTFANETTIVNNVIINNSIGILFDPFILNEKQNLKDSFTHDKLNPKDLFSHNSKILEQGNNSNHNTVLQNTISNNYMGVIIIFSCNNTLISNSFLQNAIGLVLFPGSYSNLISHNTFLNDGLMVYNDTYHNVVINNTINNKPLIYLEGQSNKVITEDSGQIILVQCHNITIENQEITNIGIGIELIETTHCSISQNNIESNNLYGILLWHSSNNIFIKNTIHANHQGIQMWGEDNTFTNNTITFNTQDGLHLYHSNNTTITGNDISNNHYGVYSGAYSSTTIENNNISDNTYGIMIYGHPESYNFITGNNIHQNTQCGIQFNDVRNTILLNNNITSNTYKGISANYCENILILNNTISHHTNGIQLSSSNNNFFSGNTIISNLDGIELSGSDHNIISGSNFISNNTCGINFNSCNSNTISNNNLVNNEANGIEFSGSSNNIITDNSIFCNETIRGDKEGIGLFYSNNNTINDNSIINATIGIEITDSSCHNSIRRNHISESDFEAIKCSSGSNNDICGNILKENGIGITISYSHHTTIANNVISHTTNTGIELSWSSDNTINNNNVSLNTNGIIVGYSSTHNILKENTIGENRETGIALMTDAADNTIIDNLILRNTLGVNTSGYQNTISNNNISLNTNGIIVGYSSTHNTLKENTIRGNLETGITLMHDAADNMVIDNVMRKNTLGITISGNQNTINHNIISNNSYGVNISYGSNNIICCNNFLDNKKNAGFKVLFAYRNNQWNKNYWDRSRILPQPILGRMSWRNPTISIPWLTFDWHPARKPYDIV